MDIEDAAVPCGTCRLCCQDHNLVPLAPELGDEPVGYQTQTVKVGGEATLALAWKPNGDCVYLSEQGCTIHGRAPVVCRVFDCREFWRSKTRNERRRLLKTGVATKAIFEAGRRLVQQGEGRA